ncbi:hypothetical protein AACH06_29495 [Ideonella sp. DXS29W]|uniref:DUF4395 domain-containing protein n=1 Tax=Ideonella lacteola TaxID=2984193 RepID=A0ABU9C292_9BURK
MHFRAIALSKFPVTAFGAMLAVAALFPLFLIVLCFVLPQLGIVIALLWVPALARLYPYFFAGDWVHTSPVGVHRYLDWPFALPLTIVHWLVLSAVFALLAKRLRGAALVAAAGAFLVIAGVATHFACTAAGIQLPVRQPHL